MHKSLVSAIIIFLDAEQFIEEAIESVLSQTYNQWELLLVDDGSTDASTQIAQEYALQFPDRVRYLEHEGHRNRGMGASRNVGIRQARGEYVAFLDADDIWLPNKLDEQVRILDAHPSVGMLYGNTKYWYSWAKAPEANVSDFIPALGVTPHSIVEPPNLLSLFLRGRAAVPCPTSILVRRSTAEDVDGFDESFVGDARIYEDQAFYAKFCLMSRVYVSDQCWDWYRQHPDQSVAVVRRQGHEQTARRFFLNWLEDYLCRQQVTTPEVWQSLRREQWLNRDVAWIPNTRRARRLARWFKKWSLRLEEHLFPKSFQHWLWATRLVSIFLWVCLSYCEFVNKIKVG